MKGNGVAKYKVIGPHSVAGVETGGVVELDPEEAGWLVEAGHLELDATPKPKAKAAGIHQSDPELNKGGEQT
jgi:uncharacterized protein YhdP